AAPRRSPWIRAPTSWSRTSASATRPRRAGGLICTWSCGTRSRRWICACLRSCRGATAKARSRRFAPGSKGAPTLRDALRFRCADGALERALERAQLGDEVVGVAAVVRLGELDSPPVAQESETLYKKSRVAGFRLQQLGLIGGQQQRMQALQRAHRTI